MIAALTIQDIPSKCTVKLLIPAGSRTVAGSQIKAGSPI